MCHLELFGGMHGAGSLLYPPLLSGAFSQRMGRAHAGSHGPNPRPTSPSLSPRTSPFIGPHGFAHGPIIWSTWDQSSSYDYKSPSAPRTGLCPMPFCTYLYLARIQSLITLSPTSDYFSFSFFVSLVSLPHIWLSTSGTRSHLCSIYSHFVP